MSASFCLPNPVDVSVSSSAAADKAHVFNSSHLRMWFSHAFRTSSACSERTTISSLS